MSTTGFPENNPDILPITSIPKKYWKPFIITKIKNIATASIPKYFIPDESLDGEEDDEELESKKLDKEEEEEDDEDDDEESPKEKNIVI